MKFAFSWLLDLLYPRDCFFCQRPAGKHGHICQECFERIPVVRNPSCSICGAESTLSEGPDFICDECLQHRPAFERAIVATRYAGAIRDLIHCFKYHRGIWLLDDLILWMQAAYIEQIEGKNIHIDALVPIPMLPRKRRHRGYNQASLLAAALGKVLTLPCREKLLRRVDTGILSQTHLRRKERLVNALAAYRTEHPRHIRGQTLLLIDDVMTTGATCHACAHLLKAAGAKTVYVLVLARGLHNS
ncbi:MAG: ComF family protein [Kiritimatiellia bacterium]